MRPFYAYKEGETYYLYLDPAAAGACRPKPSRSASWNDNPQLHFTNVVGATAECTFEGSGIRWRGFKFDDAGRAEVTIDGKVVAIVDQYDPGRGFAFEWSSPKLAPGKHTIRLKLLEEKTPQSKDRFINVAGFDILREP